MIQNIIPTQVHIQTQSISPPESKLLSSWDPIKQNKLCILYVKDESLNSPLETSINHMPTNYNLNLKTWNKKKQAKRKKSIYSKKKNPPKVSTNQVQQ